MLTTLLRHIQTYEHQNDKDSAFAVIAMVITRLYQVEASQLQRLVVSQLESLLTSLLS